MAKGKRRSQEVQRTIAMRVHNGENRGDLAKEFGVTKDTIGNYVKKFPNQNPRRVMKKVAPKPAKLNSEIIWLRDDLFFYQNAFYKRVGVLQD